MSEETNNGYFVYPIIKALVFFAIFDIAANYRFDDPYSFVCGVSVVAIIACAVATPKVKFGRHMLGLLLTYVSYIALLFIFFDTITIISILNVNEDVSGVFGAIVNLYAFMNTLFPIDFFISGFILLIKSSKKSVQTY